MEVLPYFSPWQVVPWHLLEADHKNFFTRGNLGAVFAEPFRSRGGFQLCRPSTAHARWHRAAWAPLRGRGQVMALLGRLGFPQQFFESIAKYS